MLKGLLACRQIGGANLICRKFCYGAVGGRLLAIGTTTPQAYRGSIEQSSGLFRASSRDVREVDATPRS